MWQFALALWFILIYFSFAVLVFLNTARGANVVHGGWLIAIVRTEFFDPWRDSCAGNG